MVQNNRTNNANMNAMSFDTKKSSPLGVGSGVGMGVGGVGLTTDITGAHHAMPMHHHPAHNPLSHYTSQMHGMKAAMSAGGAAAAAAAAGIVPPAGTPTGRSAITDFFGKMMSFSSCQTPVLPSYYQNAMYSSEKVDSHL